MDASILAQVLRDLPAIEDPNVLVGTSTADDAGVLRISDQLALVQTVDFFTPIVDDPYEFGSIAAANALSDVYAMGGKPISALAIAAFPEDLEPNILAEILRGGAEKAKEAGIDVIGGHTIDDAEPKYGLAVTGVVHPDRIVRNDTGRAGDALILTKPLGTGILTTARRRDAINDAAMQEAIHSMQTLNKAACEVMLRYEVHAATDITGFGLLGHLAEMTGKKCGAEITASAVPTFDGVVTLAEGGFVPGGSRANLASAIQSGVRFDESLPESMRLVLCDAQTSGGLLFAVRADDAGAAVAELQARSIPASCVGRLTEQAGIRISG